MRTPLSEEKRATLAEDLIKKAIRAEQRNHKDDFTRGRLDGLRTAFILLTGRPLEEMPDLTGAEVIKLPIKKKWDFPVRRSRK